MPKERECYAKKYKVCKGNWDLYIPFWEKSFKLLNQYGNVALITPDKWLSIKYGKALRSCILPYIYNISNYSTFYAFESAGVSTVVVMAQRKEINKIRVVHFDELFDVVDEVKVDKFYLNKYDNIGLCLSKNLKTLINLMTNEQLGDSFNINGAATVSETYEIAKIVEDVSDYDANLYFKFINTGIIDKFGNRWGTKQMTYVKIKYNFPVVNKNELKKMFPKRYKQAESSKLITTGIRYLKVFGDFNGEYLAAKSTEVITPKEGANIKCILPILNSSVVFFFMKEAYGGMALGGGITFSPDNLSKIPIPKIDNEDMNRLEAIADELSKSCFDCTNQDELDSYIYQLYNLNDYDIQVIEKFKKQ